MGRDFYAILGVSKDASDSQIKSAYKKLALKHHPDRNPGQEDEAAAKFKDVSSAFEVLSDGQKRATYDKFGEEGLEGGGMGGMGGMDPNDLFASLFGGGGGGFFGGGGGQRNAGPRKGKDLVHRIKVSLEDLYKGKTSKLALQKQVLCGNGKGGKEGAVKTCHGCNGQGIKVILRQMGPMVQRMQQTCPDCNGEGQIINPKDRCKSCHGQKIMPERKVLEVNVDKGMKEGQTVTFPGEADQSPGVVPGDVIIVIEEKPHDTFKRKGDDLYMEQSIDLLTALAGGQFLVKHLDDRSLLVNIMPGEIIKPNAIKVIDEAGMPAYRHHNHGQLIILFTIDFPDTLTPEAIQHIEAALPARPTLPKAPKDHHIEEVVLSDADPTRQARARGQDEDMDEDDQPQGQGVSCQNQ